MQKTIALAALFVIMMAVLTFNSCNSNSSANQQSTAGDSLQQAVKHGQYLALHVAACIHCHSHRDFTKFSGPVVAGTEGGGGQRFDSTVVSSIPGVIYSSNITPDSATGIGTWSDADIIRAITRGIAKNGDTLFPLMPYANFNHMTRRDLMDIIAYLRTLKPIHNAVPAHQLAIPIAWAYPAPALTGSLYSNQCPPPSDSLHYGAYLIGIAGCGDCHTPFIKGGRDFQHVLSGGMTFHVAGFVVNSANITPDSATGIGTWDEATFLRKFTVCRDRKNYDYNPGKQNTVMPISEFAGMNDGDLKSIFIYLRSVPPVKNLVVKYPQ